MSSGNPARHLLATLTARVNHARQVPMFQRGALLDEIITLQLALLGELVEQIETKERKEL
jgi:hypothetical protein